MGATLQNTVLLLPLRSSSWTLNKAYVGESTVRLLKKKYLEELKKAKESVSTGEAPQVKEIAAKTHGRPLLVGEFTNDVSNVHQGS